MRRNFKVILPRNTLQHEFNSPGSLRGLCPVVVEMLKEDDFFFLHVFLVAV